MATVQPEGDFVGQHRKVTHPYQPTNLDELKLIVGSTVRLTETPTGGWWCGESVEFNDSGWFPNNHISVEAIPTPKGSPQRNKDQSANPKTANEEEKKSTLTKKTDTPSMLLQNDVLQSLLDLDGFLDASDRKSVASVVVPTSRESVISAKKVEALKKPRSPEKPKSAPEPPKGDSPKKGDSLEKRKPGPPVFAIAQFEFKPRNEDELGFKPSDRIELVETPEGGWWLGRLEGREGWFPSNHATKEAELAASAAASSEREDVLAPLRDHGQDNAATPRARLTSFSSKMRLRRSELNAEIAKQLQLRAGAEKLLQALPDKGKQNKANREEVHVTLSFVNARIQNLRFNLQQLNESIHANVRKSVFFQNNDLDLGTVTDDATLEKALSTTAAQDHLPLIAFGMKETNHVDLKAAFSNSIKNLYAEDASDFAEELNKVQSLRNVIEEHIRDSTSLAYHFRYYHQYSHLESRFFSKGKHPDIVYHWFDSFNGQPTMQKSNALERACVLFNAGALCSQIAAGQNLNSVKGLKLACEHLQIAAGAFQFIKDNFLHPPSADLSPPSLTMLVSLSLAQAQECLFQLSCRLSPENEAPSAESAYVGELYAQAHQLLSSNVLRAYVPPAWIHFTNVKALHFDAVADVQTGKEQLAEVRSEASNSATATWTGVARLSRADQSFRKALKMCRELLPKMTSLYNVVKREHTKLQSLLSEDHVAPVLERMVANEDLKHMLPTKGNVQVASQPVYPDLYERADGSHPVKDMFEKLGPSTFFNTLNEFGSQKDYELTSNSTHGFGFTLGGNAPVGVHEVVPGSPAAELGIKRGVILTRVNDEDVKHSRHEEVIQLFRKSQQVKLRLQIVKKLVRKKAQPQIKLDEDAKIITSRGSDVSEGSASQTGFGNKQFSLTGKQSMQNLSVPATPKNMSNRSSHSMTDELPEEFMLPDGANIFGDQERAFKNPLYAAKYSDEG